MIEETDHDIAKAVVHKLWPAAHLRFTALKFYVIEVLSIHSCKLEVYPLDEI
jgi:hypothetical protein